MKRTNPKAPALTTATAWSRALTGVGATIAVGSHPWSGITAAFTPQPSTNSTKIVRRAASEPFPARKPPGVNPAPGAIWCTHTTATRRSCPAISV